MPEPGEEGGRSVCRNVPIEREDTVWYAFSPILDSAPKYASLVAARAENREEGVGGVDGGDTTAVIPRN